MATIDKRAGKFRVQIRRKGYRSVSKSFNTLKEARIWAKESELNVENDCPICDDIPITLKDCLIRYKNEITPTKRGADRERCKIDVWLKDPIAVRPLPSIKPIDIVRWRDEQTRLGKAPSTIRNSITIISQIFKVAATEWGFENIINPVTNVRMPKNRPGRVRRLVDDEYERLLKAAQEDCNPHIAPAFILSVASAMRQGELLSMQWDHLKLEKRVVHLPAAITKTNKSRSVPLSSTAIRTISSLPRDHDNVIPLKKTTLHKAWLRCLKACGIDDLHWHDLRHHAISCMMEKGLSPYQVMQISGHSTTAMLKRYTHFHTEDLADLLD